MEATTRINNMGCPICKSKLELIKFSVYNDSEKRGLFCEKHNSIFGIVSYRKSLRDLGVGDYQIITNEKEIFEEVCTKKMKEDFGIN